MTGRASGNYLGEVRVNLAETVRIPIPDHSPASLDDRVVEHVAVPNIEDPSCAIGAIGPAPV